jgi:hypothetical protein
MGRRDPQVAIGLRCGVALVLWAAAAEAPAQSRRELSLTPAPMVGQLGKNSALSSFTYHSFGLGGLDSTYSGPGTHVLRSSIYEAGAYSLRRGNLGYTPSAGDVLWSGSPGSLSVPRSGLGVGRYDVGGGAASPLTEIPVAPPAVGTAVPRGASPLAGGGGTAGLGGAEASGPGIGSALAKQDETAFGAARAYLWALEQAATSLLSEQRKPITSLVPKPASVYRDNMLKGDSAFRANNYRYAYSYFQIAADIGGNDPESLICLTHAQFALSHYSYAKAAYFLELALKSMPELPLASLRPMGFYGDRDKYAQHVFALEEQTRSDPYDGEAQLLLAYFRWFSEVRDVPAASKALSQAMAAALRKRDTYLLEAVRTFWDGMVAAGKATGTLEPAPEADKAASAREATGGAPAGGKAEAARDREDGS